MSDLVGNPEDRFSHTEALLILYASCLAAGLSLIKTKLEEYKADANEALCFKLGMYLIDAHYSLRKIFRVVAGQLSDSQNIFFGQNRKIIGFCFIQIHVLVFSNSVNTANLTKKVKIF